MIKNCLFAVALLSLALAGGCAKGGNGMGSGITVSVSDGNVPAIFPTQSVTFTATVTGTTNTAVTWSLSGSACTGTPNPCGAIDPNTGVYTAPATAPNPAAITITAVSAADSTATGVLQVHVVPVTVVVTPTPVTVGQNLVQQFTAVELPDDAPQKFAWSCTPTGSCGSLVQDANISGLAVYTAPASNGPVVVSATSAVQQSPAGVGQAKVTVAASRLTANTSYALRFSGYDSADHPVAIAGSVTFGANGTVTGGVEDVVINGVYHQYTALTGLYAPSTATDNNSNNAGTLTLSASGGPSDTYAVVLDAAGNLRMIESGNVTGSGAMEKSATAQFNSAPQKFVFGFSGVDSSGKRVGYVGLLPLDGNGNISGGMADTNDNGTATSACAAPPCTVTGTYQLVSGVWTLHLLLGSQALDFDFYIGSGQSTANTKTPLTLNAISTTVDATHPTLSGRMVLQDSGTTYDKTALNSDSVSHLTGVDGTGSNSLVSLVAARGDGNGNIGESFDANNAGTIVQAAAQASPCTYTTATGGRYVVTLLGSGTSCTGGLPFVLYASGKNRGFLLDQSSAAVMTGAMDPQTGNGSFGGSELPSTYAVATVSSATSGVTPTAANLLLTSPGNQVFKVAGTLYPGTLAVTGTYTLTFAGTGTIKLTSPAANYVIYATDTSHFEMIDVDQTVTNASVIFAQQ